MCNALRKKKKKQDLGLHFAEKKEKKRNLCLRFDSDGVTTSSLPAIGPASPAIQRCLPTPKILKLR